MDPKEISAFLAPPTLTAKETLLGFTGGAIALLVVASGTSFYNHDYRHARAEVPGCLFHNLRRSSARNLIRSGKIKNCSPTELV